MSQFLHIWRVICTTALLVASLAAASAALAANVRPVGVSPQEYRAMMIRGEALNELYGLGANAGPSRADLIRAAALDKRYGNAWTRVSPAEFRTLVGVFGPDVTTSMTPQQARAELARGQGLNRVAQHYATTAGPVATSQGTSFHWADAGIGVAAAFGAMLLAAAGAIGLRRRSRLVAR